MDLKVTTNRAKNLFLTSLLMFTLFGCREKTTYKPTYTKSGLKKKTLILGCSNRSYYEPYDQIVQYLNKRLKNVQLKVVAGANYEVFLNNVSKRTYDITILNGIEALKAEKNGYKIIAKFENDSSYYSVIIANKNAKVHDVKDLIGKKYAVACKGSIMGELAPMVFLQKKGLNVYQELYWTYYPSFETTILNVYLDKCDAGSVMAAPWKRYIKSHPDVLNKVEIKWQTDKLLNLGIVIKNEIDPKIREEIVNLFLNMHNDAVGKRALEGLEFTRVIKADSTTYAPMRKLQKEFDQLPK